MTDLCGSTQCTLCFRYLKRGSVELVTGFNPTQFNADEWVATAKRAGMSYLIITSKHHDGFAMYDSDVREYNVVKASAWKHDPMKDLKEYRHMPQKIQTSVE